jgi:hypothetical protein
MSRVAELSRKSGSNGNGVHEPPTLPPKAPEQKKEVVQIKRPNIKMMRLHITGSAPYLQCRFPQKAINQIAAKQQKGDTGSGGEKAVRQARDFEADYLGSMHKISDTEYGIPAAAFRAGAISACRLVNFKMTIAKMSIFIVPDGYDVIDQTALVKIIGKPQRHEMMGRNADGGADIRIRAIWQKWECDLTVRFDADQFGPTAVVNLMSRVGQQVGIGEGRPDSKKSAGMGFGLFDVSI